jgi:hypothetical protein
MRRTGGLHDATEQTFDFAASFLATFIIIEMNTYPLCATILRASRGHPNNRSGNR